MDTSYIGTSGFYYDDWKGKFYPDEVKKTDWFMYYMTKFNTIEINSTFYRTPRYSTVEHWKNLAPKDFIFTFKASRFITQSLHFKEETLNRFFAAIQPFASDKKHVVLFQSPKTLSLKIERLDSLIRQLPDSYRYAFEFRHKSWFVEEVYALLRKHNAALVMADSPRQGNDFLWPKVNIDTADFFYIRFHGPKTLYNSSYSKTQLEDYKKIINEKRKNRMDVFCYFNNDFHGYAIDNVHTLTQFLTENSK